MGAFCINGEICLDTLLASCVEGHTSCTVPVGFGFEYCNTFMNVSYFKYDSIVAFKFLVRQRCKCRDYDPPQFPIQSSTNAHDVGDRRIRVTIFRVEVFQILCVLRRPRKWDKLGRKNKGEESSSRRKYLHRA